MLCQIDLVIVGGGIAGLWTLAKARAQGIDAVLFEKEALGSGQTICSQGIIHGGSKYALQGKITGATESIAEMPKLWLQALSGEGDVKLTDTNLLAENQFLVPASGIDSKLLSFFGSKTMTSFTKSIKANDLPPNMQSLKIERNCFQLFEPVIAVDSLIADLKNQYADYIYQFELTAEQVIEHESHLAILIEHNDLKLELNAQALLLCTGEGFAGLKSIMPKQNMQLRPLHMLAMTANKDVLPQLYAHFIGRSSKPLLTVTSHPNKNNMTWYLGGNLAEDGINNSHAKQVKDAKKLLSKLLPQLDTSQFKFDSIIINRAEPEQNGLLRPDDAFLNTQSRIFTAWPTKLALAPRLAQQVIDALNKLPNQSDASADTISSAQLALPKPDCANYPWLTQ